MRGLIEKRRLFYALLLFFRFIAFGLFTVTIRVCGFKCGLSTFAYGHAIFFLEVGRLHFVVVEYELFVSDLLLRRIVYTIVPLEVDAL